MKLGVTLDILNQKDTPAFYADTLANRPAAGFTGRVFISTDTLDLYRDTGTTWVLLSPSSTGTITGSGAAGQVTYFSAASSITGSNNLFYDTGNSRLGINTNTPTAPLDVHSSLSGALMQLNQTSGILDSQLAFQSANVGKWRIGSYYNAGQYSFGIYDVFNSRERFSVLNTGQTFVGDQISSSGKLVVNSGSLGDTGLVVISQTSPSIRINNGGTGANYRCGLGISTGANNFIQGSVDGDFCIFNANTGTFPILFGINDTGLGSVQEAARVSPARNFLVGTTTDSGFKLNVSGTGRFSGQVTFGTNSRGFIREPAGDVEIGGTAGAALKLYSNDTEYARLAPSTGFTTTLPFGGTSANFSGVVTTNSYFAVDTTSSSYIIQGTFGWNNLRGTTITGKTASIYDLALYSASGGSLLVNPTATNTLAFIGGGNFLIGTTTDNGQKLQVNGDVNGINFNSERGIISVAPLAATTFFTPTSVGLYIAHIFLSGNQTQTWDASIIFLFNTTNILVANQINGTNVSISVSGANIQVTQIGGSTFNFNYDVIKIR
jgi:hypothetical protein